MQLVHGLHVVSRSDFFKTHVGILAVGVSGLLSPGAYFTNARPLGLLIHFQPDGIVREPLFDWTTWKYVRRIESAGAFQRLVAVVEQNPSYNLVSSNCEHLVSFVESAEPNSPQVKGLVLTAAFAFGVAWLAKKG